MRDAITTAGEVVGLLMLVAALAVALDSLVVFLVAGGLVVAGVSTYEGLK
jgi:hypothetical protein